MLCLNLFQCECDNIMWVIMKLGYGSPLKVPKQDDETPDIDPGISYELNYYNGGI